MKRNFSLIGLVIIFLMTAAGLSCSIDEITADNITAALGQEFTLPAGRTAVINNEDLSLKFIEVLGDSRCAKGVVCVWAGEAQCRIYIQYMGSLAEMVLVQPGGDVFGEDFFINYKFKFKLEPYPEEGKPIAASDYKLVMTVTK